MSYTTDPNDPDLGRGVDSEATTQNKKYLILSEEERAKGFVRPVRESYIHVGKQPKNPLRYLTPQEEENYGVDYVMYEEYPKGSHAVGRLWKQDELNNKGCGTVTTMGLPLAETYARNPGFYGATYCVGCNKHLPVDEFVWQGTSEKVGS